MRHVVRISVRDGIVVWRETLAGRRVGYARGRGDTVCPGERTEIVVEGVVLQHQNHHVLDRRSARCRAGRARRVDHHCTDGPCDQSRQCETSEQLAPTPPRRLGVSRSPRARAGAVSHDPCLAASQGSNGAPRARRHPARRISRKSGPVRRAGTRQATHLTMRHQLLLGARSVGLRDRCRGQSSPRRPARWRGSTRPAAATPRAASTCPTPR